MMILFRVKFPQVAKLRGVIHLSQQRLADICGLSQSLIANLESGRRVDANVALKAISAATGATVESLRAEGPLTALPVILGNLSERPFTKETFEKWQEQGPPGDYLRSIEAAKVYLGAISEAVSKDSHDRSTLGRAQAFLLRLNQFLQGEIAQAGEERVNEVLENVETEEPGRMEFGAKEIKATPEELAEELAKALPKRIIPTTGSPEFMLTERLPLPVKLSMWEEPTAGILHILDGERSVDYELNTEEYAAVKELILGSG